MSSTLELMLPWVFSPTVLLATALAVGLYARGMSRTVPPAPRSRRIAFFAGLALIYSALQTSWDYFASHAFFVLQLQHFALHDLGPALLAAAAPGATLARGLPERMQVHLPRLARALRGPAALLLDPFVATALYLVTQLIWLWPPITFGVMISNGLYRLMSWSTVLGGIPFWHLTLDPRPRPLSRLRLRYRFLILYVAMVPMMLTAAALAFSQSNWYPVYAVCGRFMQISPVADQQLGGTTMGIPGQLLFGIVLFYLARKAGQNANSAVLAGRPAPSK